MMNDSFPPLTEAVLGGPDLSPETLDAYLEALQADDPAGATTLLAAHPGLGAWTECLRDLDGLATAIAGPAGEDTTTTAPLPRPFGPYELLAELGRGGMGVVYRARHLHLGRDVAVKLLTAGSCATEEQRRRFLAESRLAARIRHPRIVSIHDGGDQEGQLWCAMDLVDGDDLAALLRDGPLPLREAVHLVAEIARAVHHLHDHGILHRDVKASNILLDRNGTPYLTDFGLARGDDSDATATGTVLGTPASMSPEQAAGRVREIDARSDVYGLGAVLYEAVGGTPPFGGNSPIDTLLDVLERDPLPPSHWNRDVPPPLDRICLRCLEKSPARRPATAAALADDLDRWLAGGQIAPLDDSFAERIARLVRRHPAAGFRLLGITGTIAIVLVRCLVDPETVGYYVPVVAGLALWGALAIGWEVLGTPRRGAGMARPLPRFRRSWMTAGTWLAAGTWLPARTWLTAALVLIDVVSVTVLLALVNGKSGPLLAVYPLLVTAAGVWLDRRLVRIVTIACLAAHVTLLVATPGPVIWHVALILDVLMLCTAAITEFQIGRIRLPRATPR
ncbi:MAG: serine/threonine protein kinase [Planctomycetaceae bacterium]|nr:serine/threonine protein kinase [Planctomycetaceae bacterium]